MNRIAPFTGIAFAGLLPLLPIAVAHADTFTWLNPVAGSWNTATSWTNNAVPPNDGTADVVFPGGTAAYQVTMPASTVSVRSLYVNSPTGEASNKAVIFSGGTLSLGAGGLAFDDSAYSCGVEFKSGKVIVATSQNWLITSAKNQTPLYFNSCTVSAPEKDAEDNPVVWTIAGKSSIACNGPNLSNMKAKLRTNAKFGFYNSIAVVNTIAAPGCLEFYDSNVPIAGNDAPGFMQAEVKSSNETVVASSPLSFDVSSKTYEFGFSRSTYISGNAWRYRVTSAMTGAVPDRKLIFSTGSSTIATHFPFKQRVTLAGDLTGLSVADDGAICLSQGVFILGSATALGTGNGLDVYFGNSSDAGFLAGLLAKDGLNAAGSLVLTPKNAHTMLGMIEPGETTYSGAITASGLAANAKTQLHLNAAKDAKVNVTGAIDLSDANNLPVVVNGGGDVVLSGDNVMMNQKGLDIRAGRVSLASDTAAGTQPISLGGAVPSVTTVRGVLDTGFDYVGGSYKYYDITAEAGVYTINKNAPLKFDGLALSADDVFLHSQPGNAAGKIYRMTSATTFQPVDNVTYAEGLRIKVTDGAFFGGKAVYMTRGATAANGGTVLLDETEPDVAVLTFGARAITNDITVTDNKSTGTSTLGGATADASTFSGAITLGRGVVFSAVSNGTVTVSGTISGAGDFTKEGQGTVALTGTISASGGLTLSGGTLQMSADAVENRTHLVWNVSAADGTGTLDADGFSFAGKTITLNVSGTLDTRNSYVLATGTTGVPSVSNELPTGWKLSASNNSLKFYYPVAGMMIRVF